MVSEPDIPQEKLDAELARFSRYQHRWMSIGFASSTIGIALMYLLIRSLVDLWPTGLTLLFGSPEIRFYAIFAAIFGPYIHMLADSAVRKRWSSLGQLTYSREFPKPDSSLAKRYWLIPIMIVLNEISGLVMFLFWKLT